jgi:cell division protease FtsH
MALESWLPIGHILPDGAQCGRPIHGGINWQIVETQGGGKALLATEDLFTKWEANGLIEDGDLRRVPFGDEVYREVSCGSSQLLVPLPDCRSPNNKSEALAFATALRETRRIDPDCPLQDALYIEKFSRLLPTYGITSRTDDDMVLGYWLTGGAHVSAKSFRRLRQMLSWMEHQALRDVVQTAGVDVDGGQSAQTFKTAESPDSDEESGTQEEQPRERGDDHRTDLDSGKPFELPGRPELEVFFNEHVIDIVRHKERYRALGIGFPSAIVLHGPPGCGKTFAVEQLIEYLGWPSFQIDASSVASPYIHETSKKVSAVFEKAIEHAPSVLVIDEMEAFLADREIGSSSSHHRIEEVAEFLRRIPEAVKNEVLIVAMTNRVDMIDPAIMRRGRFDHVIKVDFASAEEILVLLNTLLANLPHDETIDLMPLAKGLAGRPLSDVTFVVREGARLTARLGRDRLNQTFLLEALAAAPSRAREEPKRRIGFV